ncbi:cytochrome C biogenesis protein [Moraxella bovoculi]|uniref:Cytochrome c-type biogenesis protein n=2 Tax=Moraxella bovoculi TaxID=386891 RepID=A0AAC8TAG9_9GAMM|nr:cytochrome c-type biogenesis protein [Moraxella bovoculi]AKG08706.1 cytochrome C biogenesis protein [Moraxella bovoculi]AKG10612.1 cytochrome C biogenesis protein [Moraxella bovoculi]AKG12637.1 cytochrome C biogenesis protein [Moraxella bovoculi]AKG14593.1 cytochrome C biogenesis protein [Moraxella bovoculi]
MTMKKIMMATLFMGVMMQASAGIEVYEFKTSEDETRYRALIEELRCPKCQNQNLAGSDAPIALDLKQKTYEMINDGRSDTEIRDYMFERYGDFISYKPPVRPSTWILWFFPPILLVLLVIGWLYKAKKGRTPVTQGTPNQLSKSEEEQLNKLLNNHQHNKTPEDKS